MELGYVWIFVAVMLFLLGLKVVKWLMWGLAIVALGAGVYLYF